MRHLLREGERNAPLLIAIGAALIVTGWAASATMAGAQFIWLGSGVVVLGGILSRKFVWFLISVMVVLFGWGGIFALFSLI
jgi:hypothetical protein